MSTDARLQEHRISKTILPRSRRTPKFPALPIPHAPTRTCDDATLSSHAPNGDRTRHPGGRLNGKSDRGRSRSCIGAKADKAFAAGSAQAASREATGRRPSMGPRECGADPSRYQRAEESGRVSRPARGPHLWKISRIYAANRMRWTQPCMTFAWPLAKVTIETPSVTISSHSSVCSTPRISGWPVR